MSRSSKVKPLPRGKAARPALQGGKSSRAKASEDKPDGKLRGAPIVDAGRGGKAGAAADATRTVAVSPIPSEDVKLVRDSFTMPGEDFELIAVLKARALEFKRPTKKSELLRAGLQQLAALSETQLRAALAALRPLPTGRPKKKR